MSKKYGYLFYFFFILGILLLSGCVSKGGEKENIKNDCIYLCKEVKMKNISLNNGPCLSDIYKWNHTDWVCDVAHNPRISIDNLPQNQCKEYREGKAHHFVEVDENCEFIRMI